MRWSGQTHGHAHWQLQCLLQVVDLDNKHPVVRDSTLYRSKATLFSQSCASVCWRISTGLYRWSSIRVDAVSRRSQWTLSCESWALRRGSRHHDGPRSRPDPHCTWRTVADLVPIRVQPNTKWRDLFVTAVHNTKTSARSPHSSRCTHISAARSTDINLSINLAVLKLYFNSN